MEQTNFCKKMNLIKKLLEKTFKNKNDNDNNNIYIYHSKKKLFNKYEIKIIIIVFNKLLKKDNMGYNLLK